MKKSKTNSCGCSLATFKNAPCCSYSPPSIENIELRRNKKGQLQARINKKGKWVGAELDAENKAVISKNIKTEMKTKPQKQAVAIALNKAGKSKKKS